MDKTPSNLLKTLTLITIIWSLMVIALGAYTRLTDAGLGCPDWPGCYGHLTVPTAAKTIQHIDSTHPATPLIAAKAWAEMIHRYFAGTLGLLIFAVIILGFRYAARSDRQGLYIPLGTLLALLVYQPLLGMWTVTLKLMPIIVTQHLLGGLSIFSLLLLLYLAFRNKAPIKVHSPLKTLSLIGVLIVFFQILLGAWTSTNYAAITCPDFPFCQLTPWHIDFHHAFNIFSPIGQNYEGGVLGDAARKTIQMTHRVGAAIVTIYVFILTAITLFRTNDKQLMQSIMLVMGLVVLQIALGIANVLLSRPLLISVSHNLTAAFLLASLVRYAYFCHTIPECKEMSHENRYQPA